MRIIYAREIVNVIKIQRAAIPVNANKEPEGNIVIKVRALSSPSFLLLLLLVLVTPFY